MDLFKSKKFWTAILGVVSVILSSLFGLSEETVMTVGGTFIALLLGQGMADVGKSSKEIDKKSS